MMSTAGAAGVGKGSDYELISKGTFGGCPFCTPSMAVTQMCTCARRYTPRQKTKLHGN